VCGMNSPLPRRRLRQTRLQRRRLLLLQRSGRCVGVVDVVFFCFVVVVPVPVCGDFFLFRVEGHHLARILVHSLVWKCRCGRAGIFKLMIEMICVRFQAKNDTHDVLGVGSELNFGSGAGQT
jgi:hypothetical protein